MPFNLLIKYVIDYKYILMELKLVQVLERFEEKKIYWKMSY
jgi:hypothetical protein